MQWRRGLDGGGARRGAGLGGCLSLEERRGRAAQSVGALGEGQWRETAKVAAGGGGPRKERERRQHEHEGDHTTKGLSEFFYFFN